jgi:hypothetical protein
MKPLADLVWSLGSKDDPRAIPAVTANLQDAYKRGHAAGMKTGRSMELRKLTLDLAARARELSARGSFLLANQLLDEAKRLHEEDRRREDNDEDRS